MPSFRFSIHPMQFVLLAIISAGVVLCAQTPKTNSVAEEQFVGTWEGKFNGQVFQIIKLQLANGKLTGSVSHCDIETDANGDIAKAQLQNGEDPIISTKLNGNVLRVTVKQEDSSDTIQFGMTITAPNSAEIHVMVPPGMAPPKPWKVEKVKSK